MNMNKKKKRLDSFFEITKYQSSIKCEILAGIATFFAMSYILTVNPNNILYETSTADARWASIFIATAFGAAFGTLLMALLAKVPLAIAPSLGLNSALGALIGGGMGAAAGGTMPLSTALLLVFLSGVLFFLLSVIPGGKNANGTWISLREKVFDGMPKAIRTAIPVGIGLFIAFIGLQKSGLITDNAFTLVGLVDFSDPSNYQNGGPALQAFVCLFGLFAIGILSHYQVKGAVILGVLAATVLAIPLQVADFDILLGKSDGITWRFWTNFQNFFSFKPEQGGLFLAAFTEGFDAFEKADASFYMTVGVTVLSFCMIQMFDSMGTVLGCATNAGLLDEDGKPIRYSKIMVSDSTANMAASCLGTSPMTTFVESGVGIAAGGKTGLTALTVSLLFIVSIFVLPLFAFIPASAASSALIYVGVLMISNVTDIDFKQVKNAIPSFLILIMMPLTYSITEGIGIGLLAYLLIDLIQYFIEWILFWCKKRQAAPKWDLSVAFILVCIFFLLYFFLPTA